MTTGPAAPMPVADTWTVLAALAVSTRRITVGPMEACATVARSRGDLHGFDVAVISP